MRIRALPRLSCQPPAHRSLMDNITGHACAQRQHNSADAQASSGEPRQASSKSGSDKSSSSPLPNVSKSMRSLSVRMRTLVNPQTKTILDANQRTLGALIPFHVSQSVILLTDSQIPYRHTDRDRIKILLLARLSLASKEAAWATFRSANAIGQFSKSQLNSCSDSNSWDGRCKSSK
jgi:hypothetical protein